MLSRPPGSGFRVYSSFQGGVEPWDWAVDRVRSHALPTGRLEAGAPSTSEDVGTRYALPTGRLEAGAPSAIEDVGTHDAWPTGRLEAGAPSVGKSNRSWCFRSVFMPLHTLNRHFISLEQHVIHLKRQRMRCKLRPARRASRSLLDRLQPRLYRLPDRLEPQVIRPVLDVGVVQTVATDPPPPHSSPSRTSTRRGVSGSPFMSS